MAFSTDSYQFPLSEASGEHKYPGRVRFGATQRIESPSIAPGLPGSAGPGGAISKITDVDVGDATLYLPGNITFHDGVVYENVDLQFIGSKVADTLSNDYNALNKGVESLVKDVASDYANAARILTGRQLNVDDLTSQFAGMSNSEASKSAVSKVIQRFKQRDASSIITAGIGVIANPHKRSIFQDVQIRSFSFSWSLYPKSADEAMEIRNLIKFFRERMYPERLGDIAYKFPVKFDIEFFYKNKTLESAPKLLPCFLRDMTTNFNPSSNAMYRTGDFSETVITLMFQEERALSSEDIQEGY